MMRTAALTMILASTWLGSSVVRADDTARPAPPSDEKPIGSATSTSLPLEARDGVLIGGLATFGAAYWASLYVGGTSDLTADHLMLIPLAGPWLALANRNPCGPSTRAPSCGSDGTFQALFVADGVLQAAGAALVLAAFLMPHSRSETSQAAERTLVSPMRVGSGWGVGTVGHF